MPRYKGKEKEGRDKRWREGTKMHTGGKEGEGERRIVITIIIRCYD